MATNTEDTRHRYAVSRVRPRLSIQIDLHLQPHVENGANQVGNFDVLNLLVRNVGSVTCTVVQRSYGCLPNERNLLVVYDDFDAVNVLHRMSRTSTY